MAEFANDSIQGTKELIEQIQILKGELKELLKLNQEAIKGVNPAKAKAEDIEKLNKAQKNLITTEEQLSKLGEEETKLNKVLEKQQEEEIKAKILLQKANKEQRKQLEREIILREELGKEIKTNADVLGNLNDIRNIEVTNREQAIKVNKALRNIVGGLNTDIKEEAAAIKALNKTIDDNTEFISDNSDKNVQNKINIGNYAESVKEALAEVDQFNTGSADLAIIQGQINTIIALGSKVLNRYSKSARNADKATTRLGKSAKRVGAAFKASIIGILIAAVGALASFVGKTQEGQIEFQKLTARIISGAGVILGRIAEIGKGLFNLFASIGGRINAVIEAFSGNIFEASKALADAEKRARAAEKAFASAFRGGLFDEMANAAEAASKLVDSQFEAANAAREVATEIERRRAIEEQLKEISDDDTRGFLERQAAAMALGGILEGNADKLRAGIRTNRINKKLVEEINDLYGAQDIGVSKVTSSFEEQNNLAQKQLKIAQDRAFLTIQETAANKVNVEELRKRAESGESISKTLSKIILQTKNLRGENNALVIATEALDELIEAEKEAVNTELELETIRLTERARIRKILFDEVEQEVDFLFDAADQIKTSNEQIAASDKATFEERRKAIEDAEKVIADSNRRILDELAKTVKGVSGADIAKAFADAQSEEELVDTISGLNRNLKQLGLAEIPITRLLELFREIKAQERDFKDAREILDEAVLGGVETKERIAFLQEQNANIEIFAEKLRQLKDIDILGLTEEEFKQLESDLERFNKEATAQEDQRQRDQKELEIQQLKDRIDLLKEDSAERLALEEDLQEKLNDLRNFDLELEKKKLDEKLDLKRKQLEAEEKAEEDAIAEADRRRKEALAFAKRLTNELGEELRKRSEARIESLDQEAQDLQNSIDRQSELANQGKDNDLAREKERLNEVNLERKEALERQQREEEAIKLAAAFISAFEARVSDPNTDPDTAIQKAIQDVFLARGVAKTIAGTLGAFEKGGLVEGGEQFIRVNEKGQEFVIDAPTTKALGLDTPGTTMSDFNRLMYANTMPEISNTIVNSQGNLQQNPDILIPYLKDIRDDFRRSPKMSVNELLEVVEHAYRRGVQSKTTHKNRPRLT